MIGGIKIILRDWKVGALIGLFWGILGARFYYPGILGSEVFLAFGLIYMVSELFLYFFSFFTQSADLEIILIPLSGLVLGALSGMGFGLISGKFPKMKSWMKGAAIGLILGLLSALFVWTRFLFGIIFFGPLIYLTLAMERITIGSHDIYASLPVFLILLVVNSVLLGSVIGYLAGQEKTESRTPGNSPHRRPLFRIFLAILFVISLSVVLVSSGMLQPVKIFAPTYSTSFGKMTVLASFPDSPKTMSLYEVRFSGNKSVRVPEREIAIIPATVAFERLKNGDFQGMRMKCICEYTLENVSTGYYESASGTNKTYAEPAWIFRGSVSDGVRWEYYVLARADK